MSFSIQTNVNSMIAQENMRVNSLFQTRTITRLTSGYRINSSADDAAGLAVANRFRDNEAELTQGVRNANDGISQLQIVDGGLSNVSNILDRLKTLATESASQTFTGDRGTLNNEYQALLAEINRQADNVGLGANNTTNIRNIGVYIGGGQDANTNSTVNVNLTGNGIDATSLGLNNTSVLTNAAVSLGTAAAASPVLPAGTATFSVYTASGLSTIVINGNVGDTLQGQLNQLNAQLQGLGIYANLDQNNKLQFTSARAFSVSAIGSAANLVDAAADKINNTGLNNTVIAANGGGGVTVKITEGQTTATAVLSSGAAPTAADIALINTTLKSQGITDVTAVLDAVSGTGIAIQGNGRFTVQNDFAAAGTFVGNAVTAGLTAGNPNTAINAITSAIQSLGTTQGKVGGGQNALNYAINLAQSQITNFSSAQSQIRDADVAAEAANLTKAQILQQSSIAAMAQANSAPQAVLKLLQ